MRRCFERAYILSLGISALIMGYRTWVPELQTDDKPSTNPQPPTTDGQLLISNLLDTVDLCGFDDKLAGARVVTVRWFAACDFVS